MAIGAEIAPADPSPIGTVRVRAEMGGGVDLAASPPRGHEARGRGVGCLRAEVAGVLTGVTMRLCGEPRKGFALTMALWPWGCGLGCRRARGGVARPRPMEHDAQPYQGDQHQLVEKEMGDHGKTPSYKCSNEDILPGFQTVGISRRLEVHDPILIQPSIHWKMFFFMIWTLWKTSSKRTAAHANRRLSWRRIWSGVRCGIFNSGWRPVRPSLPLWRCANGLRRCVARNSTKPWPGLAHSKNASDALSRRSAWAWCRSSSMG